MLIRGCFIHTPRLGKLEILDNHLIGVRSVKINIRSLSLISIMTDIHSGLSDNNN